MGTGFTWPKSRIEFQVQLRCWMENAKDKISSAISILFDWRTRDFSLFRSLFSITKMLSEPLNLILHGRWTEFFFVCFRILRKGFIDCRAKCTLFSSMAHNEWNGTVSTLLSRCFFSLIFRDLFWCVGETLGWFTELFQFESHVGHLFV